MWLKFGCKKLYKIYISSTRTCFFKNNTTRGSQSFTSFIVPLTSDDLRPLGKISLIGDPSLFISANCVIDICTPGHVGKHIKQVCKLLWWQGTVLVLIDTNVGFGHLSHLQKKNRYQKFVLAVIWIDSCLAEWTPPTCTAETHFTEHKLPFILFDFHPNLTAKSPVNPSPLTRP